MVQLTNAKTTMKKHVNNKEVFKKRNNETYLQSERDMQFLRYIMRKGGLENKTQKTY